MKKELSPQTIAEMWSSGLNSSSSNTDNFLRKWADSGLLERLPSFQKYSGSTFDMVQVSKAQHEQLKNGVISVLDADLTKSGPHRIYSWEAGWGENLENFSQSRSSTDLVPGYFENSKFVRYWDEWWEIMDPLAEPTYLGYIVDTVIQGLQEEFPFGNIHEFGCGTGIHVARLAQHFLDKKIMGYDWASTSVLLLEAFAAELEIQNISASSFDFFQPDYSAAVDNGDLVLTVAALEQVGDDFSPFLAFLEEKSPQLIVNIEPIEELLDLDSELGLLSAKYFRKRNYLKGFYSALENLQSEGRAEIVHADRTGFGSLYIEGYSCVVWRFVG